MMREWRIVYTSVGISLAIFAFMWATYGFNEEATRINIRLSARIAAIFFAIAFGASAIQYFKKGLFTFWLVGNRKFFGITFAIIHLIHLGFIILLHKMYQPIFNIADASSLVAGGVAYFFAIAMLMTSFDQIRKLLSQQTWKRLHTIGSYWIWTIFMIFYLQSVGTQIEYLLMILMLAGVMGLRLLKIIISRKRQSN